MKKRIIIVKNIIKNIIFGLIDDLNEVGKILKAPFVKLLDILEELSHE